MRRLAPYGARATAAGHPSPVLGACARSQEVAIKKVLQDKRFKNRELQIMKMLDHVNVTTLHHFFYTEGDKVRLDRHRGPAGSGRPCERCRPVGDGTWAPPAWEPACSAH